MRRIVEEKKRDFNNQFNVAKQDILLSISPLSASKCVPYGEL